MKQWQAQLQSLIRRVVAATPELMLAWACYVGAVDTIAGEPQDLFLYGLIIIELLSLTWLRLLLAPSKIAAQKSTLRSLLGVGITGIAFFFFVVNLVFAVIALIFIIFFDPVIFVLLLLALTRRSLWRWNWSLRSVEDSQALRAHTKRAVRAHYLALLTALAMSLMLALYVDDMAMSTSLSDALMLGGMSGYFASLAIYVLTGKTPEVKPRDKAPPPQAIPKPALKPMLRILADNWISFVPGVFLLWITMGWFLGLIDINVRIIALPLSLGMGGWLVMAGAASAFDIPANSIWSFGLERASDFIARIGLLWMLSMFMFFFSIPIIFGILGQEISTGYYPPALQFGFILSIVANIYVLLRLWPIITMPFLLPVDSMPVSIRSVWRMTAGLDGFFLGAVPPMLLLLPITLLLMLPGTYLWLGKLSIYLFFVPLMALMLIERSATMAALRYDENAKT